MVKEFENVLFANAIQTVAPKPNFPTRTWGWVEYLTQRRQEPWVCHALFSRS